MLCGRLRVVKNGGGVIVNNKIYVDKIPCDYCSDVNIPMKVGQWFCEKCGKITEIIKMERVDK
jgi:hypothetical protein